MKARIDYWKGEQIRQGLIGQDLSGIAPAKTKEGTNVLSSSSGKGGGRKGLLWQLFEEQEKRAANSDWGNWETYNNALQALSKGKGKGKGPKKKGDTKGAKGDTKGGKKDAGKGIKGACWGCGAPNVRQVDCPTCKGKRSLNQMDNDDEPETAPENGEEEAADDDAWYLGGMYHLTEDADEDPDEHAEEKLYAMDPDEHAEENVYAVPTCNMFAMLSWGFTKIYTPHSNSHHSYDFLLDPRPSHDHHHPCWSGELPKQ